MTDLSTSSTAMRTRIKQVIIDSLGLEGMSAEEIADDAPLFGDAEDSLGLDSVDALELMVVFEKDFGVSIDSEEIDPEAFSTVATLESFLRGLGVEGTAETAG